MPALGRGLSSLAVAGVTTHQMPLLLQNGLAPGVAASMVSAYAVCWTLGGVGWGFVAERLPVRFALAFIYVVEAVATARRAARRHPDPQRWCSPCSMG